MFQDLLQICNRQKRNIPYSDPSGYWTNNAKQKNKNQSQATTEINNNTDPKHEVWSKYSNYQFFAVEILFLFYLSSHFQQVVSHDQWISLKFRECLFINKFELSYI